MNYLQFHAPVVHSLVPSLPPAWRLSAHERPFSPSVGRQVPTPDELRGNAAAAPISFFRQ